MDGDHADILPITKEVDLMNLFSDIYNVDKDVLKLTPSEYIKEMSLTMEERHKKLVHWSNYSKPKSFNYPPQFKVNPNVLVFQRFGPRSTNKLPLEIKNVGKSLLSMKIQCPTSIYFSMNHGGCHTAKTAPGLSFECEITFKPNEAKDYSHHLVVINKDQTFQIPIIAIGPRPILDIPDQIFLNPAPVKITTTKFIVVRNIGNAPAVFNFVTNGTHFKVSPAKGILAVRSSMLLNISFESSKVKEVTETLSLMLETGEKLLVTLHGSAENVSVRLDKSTVVHEDTFVGLKRCKTVRLINNSSNTVKFSWKKNPTQEQDLDFIESLKNKYEELKELEVLKNAKVIHFGLADAEKHKISCERIFQDELRLLEKEEFQFSHEMFALMPQKGEVWPKGFTEIIVSFEPKSCGPVSAEAYLEVSGRDCRLPLRIKGTGLGPNITLNLKTLDIDFIFLCSLHRYELTVENRGAIPGTIEYVEEPLIFGGKVEISPRSNHLNPGDMSVFIISFTSNRPGEFTEKLVFTIRESGEKLFLVFKGKIVNPTLHFDIKQIDFGVVPLGCPKKREVTLNNLSVVPVKFSLRVVPDGDVESISCEQYAKFTTKPNLPTFPKEFQVSLEENVVEPFSSKKVSITLTANKAGCFQKQLLVDMWDSENGSTSCPIHYVAQIASLSVEPDVLVIPFCFINFPYTRTLTLKNNSQVPGFFYIVPSDPNLYDWMTYSANIPQGVVPANGSIQIDITVITSTLGRQIFPIQMITFGNDYLREMCTVTCVGQGPVVTVKPLTLNWGDLPLIQTVEKTLEVSNESPVPASVTLYLTKPNSPWSASPSSFTIPSEKSVNVNILLTLSDRGKFKDTLKILIFNGKDLFVPLMATGVGSSLAIHPCITPTYNLGILFSHKKYTFDITLENKGLKMYSIVFSPFPEYRAFANAKFIYPQDLLFRMEPAKVEVMPLESKIVSLEVHSTSTGSFSQTFYWFASIGNPVKELHTTSEVTAEFVGPLIGFDKEEIYFWYNVGYEENDEKLTDTVQVINKSVLPISVEVWTSQPFSIETEQGGSIHSCELSLDGLKSTELTIKFTANIHENKVSKLYKGKLSVVFKEQSKASFVPLKGEINYPNIVVEPKNVDFGYVLVGTSSCKEINLINISPLTVHYDINWNVMASQVVPFVRKPSSEPVQSENGATNERTRLSIAAESYQEEVCLSEPSVLENQTDSTKPLTPPVKPVPTFPEIEISDIDVKTALFPIARNYYICDDDLMDAYKMVLSSNPEKEETETCTDLFDITPFYGKLEPFSSQVLTVAFSSSFTVKAHVEAILNVRAGPMEVITIDTVSSEIDFQLSTTELDFGKQLFCETNSKVLKLQNVAAMPFSYEIELENKGVCEVNENFPLGRGVLTVSPGSGMVDSFSAVELIVRYHPGVPGKFEDVFYLQIDHLEPTIVTVKGVGVFPQVYVSLPRPDILNIPPKIGYEAVASITPEWYLTQFASGSGMYDLHLLKPYRSRESNLHSYAEEVEDHEKWEIINFHDSVPSEIDIYLAVERILAYNLVPQDSLTNSIFAVYARTIPRFNVPAYELDFGVCVIGRAVERQITITNFGPLPFVIYGIFDSSLKEDGIYVRLKNRNELKIGASLSFSVIFHPKKTSYKAAYKKLQTYFYFEIYHGPKIPVKIIAEVTYPQVIASMVVLNFSSVVCGCSKIIKLRLKNPGLVSAKCSFFMKPETCTLDTSDAHRINPKDMKSQFHLDRNSDSLNPGEYCTIEVCFKPEIGGSFSSVLNVIVAKSQCHLKILLLGEAKEPKLKISKRFLNFKSSLPYPNKLDKVFTVENPCPFPVEFYFPEFDTQIYEEEKIIRAVTLYYKRNQIFLPVRHPGEGLPFEIMEFYNLLLDNLNGKYVEEEKDKILAEREKENVDDSVQSVFLAEEESSLGLSQSAIAEKKKRKFRRLSRSRTSVETSREYGGLGREPTVASIFEKKTSSEIEEMLEDYILSIRDREPFYDPVQAAFKAIQPPVKEKEYIDGTLIIFHGAPHTNSIQLANRASLCVDMQALSIDRIVMEEAAYGRSEAGMSAKYIIEQAYIDCVGIEASYFEWNESEVEVSEDSDFERNFEEILRKFKTVINLKREGMATVKDKNDVPTSAKSSLSKKFDRGDPVNLKTVNAPLLNIPEETILEMLKYRLALEVSDGLIIEGLQSELITSPSKALTVLLKAVGNVKNIVVGFFLSNFAQYNQQLLNKQKEKEMEELQVREKILEILEEEPVEVFESLDFGNFDADSLRAFFVSQREESYMVFEKKKERFYEMEKMKREAIKQGLPVPILPVYALQLEPVQEKKETEKKKEVNKPPKTSEPTNRKMEPESKLGGPKRDSLEGEFLSFEMDFMEMKSLIETWDQSVGGPVVDFGSDTKPKKGQTPRKSPSARKKKGRGVFLWLVDVSKPNGNSFMSCCSYLKTCFREQNLPSESDSWPLETYESLTFSCVTALPKRTREPYQNVFTISATENVRLMGEDVCEDLGEYTIPEINTKLNRSLSSISFKSKAKGSVSSRRKRMDSRISNDLKCCKSRKTSSSFGFEENQFKPRWILNPGESQSYRVRYFPTEIGQYKHKYELSIVNWCNDDIVRCKGGCDIPQIDMKPETLFPAVHQCKPLTSVFIPAFYYEENAYDFGSIIITSIEEKKSSERSVTFNVSNISSIPVDMCVVFGEDGAPDDLNGSEHIQIQPDKLWVRPGQQKPLTVTATPAKLGLNSETLLLIIKDNPKVERIKVLLEGVKANVTINPSALNFDRLLLHRNEFRRVVFTNENMLPLYVIFRGLEEFPSQFTFSHNCGWIPPLETLDMEIHYSATEVQLIEEKPIFVQVYTSTDAHEPVQEITFTISVEAYDAALDVIYMSPEDDHIDFSDIRVQNNYTIEFILKNSGKYQLGYKVEIDYAFLSQSDNEQFYVTPKEGKLAPGKPQTVAVNFIAQNEVSWKKMPLFRIMLIEPFCADELIATIPIEVSARSHFSRYELLPPKQFNFGHLRLGSITTGSLLLENKGHFSISFSIETHSYNLLQDESDVSKKLSKLSASSKEKGDKGKKGSVLKIGPFEVSPNSGTTEAGQSSVIKITCNPTEVRQYEEKVLFFVNESLPVFKKGNPFSILAESCLPLLRLQDYKSIFREHFVFPSEDDFNLKVKIGSCTVYTENNNLFSFKNICVNKKAEARLQLQNAGLIDCLVSASLTQNEETSSQEPCFGLSTEKLTIEPYNTGSLILTFQPNAIETYSGRLTLTLDMPDGIEDEVQVFKLFGNGILPQIEITEPKTKLPEGQTLVNFPPVSPGHKSTTSIAFTNTGVLDCKVIIELYKNQNSAFTLTPKPGTENALKDWQLIKPIDLTAIISLAPCQTAEFEVTFAPKEVQTVCSEIKLFIVDNPFENWSYKLTGEVFFEEVVIERIKTTTPFLLEDENEIKLSPIAPNQYFINLGGCYVKKKSQVLLRLSNKTKKDYFKFEWDELQSITVCPNVGHLYPNSSKEILVTFYPEEPMELEDITISCILNKITFHALPDPSWDSRLILMPKSPIPRNATPRSSTNTITNTGRMFKEEPEHEVIPESNRFLYVNVSGVADYPKLSCDVTKIIFKNTYMFQRRIYTLVLENSGNVALDYKLMLKSVTVWPLKENKMSQVGEKSLLGMKRCSSRPQSSLSKNTPSSRCSNRPRPLTSVPVLNLREDSRDNLNKQNEQVPEEPVQLNYNPFTIENATGRISPKEKACCNIVFSPMDINEYKAIFYIHVPNLHPDCIIPEIDVKASSIMPYCHFDVPESDYLESGRRDHTRPGPVGFAPGVPLDPETKAIEIKVLGIGITTPIKFHVINPTEDDYDFSWTNITQIQPGSIPSFHCSTVDGRIRAGRQQLMCFTFVSQRKGITEAFWKFSIPACGVETPFLFVGEVREPAVYFLTNHVTLMPTFIGSSSSGVITLVNNEDAAFEFYFQSESLYSEGRLNQLKVEPNAGEILPNSELGFRITFTGKVPGKTSFNIKCKIKSIKEPFTVSVEATTYIVQPLVVFEDLNKIKHYPDINKENVMDFGSELIVNTPETITLTLTSLSKTSFYYEWESDKKILEMKHCKIKYTPKSGHVAAFGKGKCEVTILFCKKSSLYNYPVQLKIRRGPTFYFLINGSASTPYCELSFTSYDFGYCLIQEKDICFYETRLTVKNKDSTNMILECSIPESSAFSCCGLDPVLLPGGEVSILVQFHPKECVLYKEQMKITVNGNTEKFVCLTGHGTEFKVSLLDAEDTTVSLGAVKVGKATTRKLSLVNKSLATVTMLVGYSDQLPISGSYLAEGSKINFSQDHRLSGTLTIYPNYFKMKPQEVFTLNIIYSPQKRTSCFSETVYMQCQERVEPLCVLTGCCLGPEISLDRYFLNFGAVVEGCQNALKLKLINSGSIGARFEWCAKDIADYDLFPTHGYCSPESDVTITVTFCPSAVQNCIKREIECQLYLSESETYPSLWLEVIGDCVTLPEPADTLTFECLVRKSDWKMIQITNTSGNEWQLLPVVNGEYFKGNDALLVPGSSSVEYQVDYCPLMMTQEGTVHQGSVLFKLPNGQGLLYQLKGKSLPPEPEETITREIPCKTKYIELLKIQNWLHHPQRFKINISCVDDQNDPVCTCTGIEYMEVSALAQKEYSLNFFAYNIGYRRFHVTFVNEETKEYVWYDVGFNVYMCGPLEVLTFRSGVRQTYTHELKLENPLKQIVHYELESTSPDVHFEQNSYEVLPEQSLYVKVLFTPIHPGERTEKLMASCVELGVFPRELRLVALEALPDPPRKFEASLGAAHTEEFLVKNLTGSTAVLRCKVDCDDFILHESGPLGPQDTKIKVTYEPSDITTTTATLTVESEQAGNFTFPLLGVCVKPLPKGPFTLKSGSSSSITFKNVFKKPKEFHFYVDNPSFILKTTTETLAPKEEFKISVTLQKTKYIEKMAEYKETELNFKYPVMGQLVVECFSPYVKWQFYLKGVLDK